MWKGVHDWHGQSMLRRIFERITTPMSRHRPFVPTDALHCNIPEGAGPLLLSPRYANSVGVCQNAPDPRATWHTALHTVTGGAGRKRRLPQRKPDRYAATALRSDSLRAAAMRFIIAPFIIAPWRRPVAKLFSCSTR